MSDKQVRLGSADIYMVEYTGTIPDDATLEAEANLLGETKGGAILTYSREVYTAKSDNGKAQKTRVTSESAVLKTGVMTIDDSVWQRLSDGASVEEVDGKKTVLLGGLDNQTDKLFVIRAIQKDDLDGDLKITIIGKNTASFEFSATTGAETVLNAEFMAYPLIDSTGRLVKIEY